MNSKWCKRLRGMARTIAADNQWTASLELIQMHRPRVQRTFIANLPESVRGVYIDLKRSFPRPPKEPA